MPTRRCYYCKAMSNFDLGGIDVGGKLKGVVSLDRCQNCGTPAYFVAEGQQHRDKILDRYPKVETEPDKELSAEVKVAFSEAMNRH